MFNEFLGLLRCEATRRSYGYGVRWLVGDPDTFLELVKKDRRGAEDFLIHSVVDRRDGVSGSSLRNGLMALKSFLNFYEVGLNWRRVFSVVPAPRRVALDRAPTLEEVRRLLTVCDLRMRVVVLMLLSSGMRAGGFDGLKVGDVKFLESGVGRLRVYGGSNEEYWTFVTPECCNMLKEYFEARCRAGEELSAKSPLLRDKWCYENRSHKMDPAIVKPFISKAISNRLNVLWVKAGVRLFSSGKYVRGEFQQVHGFRKYFKTQAEHVLRRDDVEVLMGHLLNYYKPSLEHLEEEYVKALPYLTVSEVEEVKREATSSQVVFEERLRRLEETLSRLSLQAVREGFVQDHGRREDTSHEIG